MLDGVLPFPLDPGALVKFLAKSGLKGACGFAVSSQFSTNPTWNILGSASKVFAGNFQWSEEGGYGGTFLPGGFFKLSGSERNDWDRDKDGVGDPGWAGGGSSL